MGGRIRLEAAGREEENGGLGSEGRNGEQSQAPLYRSGLLNTIMLLETSMLHGRRLSAYKTI